MRRGGGKMADSRERNVTCSRDTLIIIGLFQTNVYFLIAGLSFTNQIERDVAYEYRNCCG